MSASMNETPIKTPQSSKHLAASENTLSTPLFVPPTPMLKELGYGTGTYVMKHQMQISILVDKLPFCCYFCDLVVNYCVCVCISLMCSCVRIRSKKGEILFENSVQCNSIEIKVI